ncbi:beta-xylosidase [Mucilaginibacter sp. PAMC 26640]|nr:beta-xylosidase [Mucilaginibacter sp. PAMC 26640]
MMQHLKAIVLLHILICVFPFTLLAQHNNGAVIPGDFADPSIIKAGNKYFAVGTSSEWAPHFPLYQSSDLKHWRQSGYVFNKTPEWASGSFWAPEYYKIKDTYYIYYTARRKTDNKSYIGVATSKYPDKAFTDHGVLVAFGSEAIDAFIFNDNGQLYITFKAYGLDNRPIEILGSKLSADGLKLEGQPFSLLKDEQRIGMEGQSFLKKDGFYYLFYSAGNCCGGNCGYNVRVARSRSFKGPYTYYSANPILSENEKWKCMGHGTFIKGPTGADMYLHHAYNRESTVFTGRQGLISELVRPTKEGWPLFKTQQITGDEPADINESFNGQLPANFWQWDFRNAAPAISQHKGILHLSGTVKPGNETGIVLTARPVSGNLSIATTVVNHNNALKGLCLYGDATIAVGIGVQNNQITLWEVTANKYSSLKKVPANDKLPVQLKLELVGTKTCVFYYRQGTSKWKQLKTDTALKTDLLPQWDRSPRAGLHFNGDDKLDAQFSDFRMVNQ